MLVLLFEVQLINNYHLLRFFGAQNQNLSHLRLLPYMRFDFEELDDFVWSGIVFQGNYDSGILPFIFAPSLFAG